MDSYTILNIGQAVGVLSLGIGSTVFSRRAADRSQRAAELSAPTGNGWTNGLGKRLDKLDASNERIETSLRETNAALVRHLQDHIRHADDGK